MTHLPSFSIKRRLPWTTVALLLSVSAVVWSPKANADTARLQSLLQRNNCTACHLIDKRKYGPNLNEVAARYAGNAEAVALLATKIRAGGSGVWGEDMMPPQANVSEVDARAMAELILALKP